MPSVVLMWSQSAPKPLSQPASTSPKTASSMTDRALRPRRSISRIDCCARTGMTFPPCAPKARAWPGVARPVRSPVPTEVRWPPISWGRRAGKAACRAFAFAVVREPVSTWPSPAAEASPSKAVRASAVEASSWSERTEPS